MAPAGLKPHEEGWREVFNNLSGRFPSVPGQRVAQALREHNGHAGEAAAALRDLTSCTVKEADPDDVEHVSTLLSSPAMFKHACKEQFRKFDVNKDGVLEFEEVKQLTTNLYEEFGLPVPSEGSLKAFFHATDENMDGVLSEREFRKFFEMFLRYAFFDHLKLRQMVEKGQEIERKRSSLQVGEIPVIAEVGNDSPPDSRASSASDGSKRNKENKGPTLDETEAPPPPAQKVKSKPDALVPIAGRSPEHSHRRRSPQNAEQDRSHDRSHRDREHQKEKDRKGGRQDKERERAASHEATEGPFGGAVRCLAQNGVAYRASPAFQDRLETVVARGATVQVLEHWVRTPDGWLPVMDTQCQPLFERSNADPADGDHHHHKKRVSIQERKDDTLDVNVRSASSRQKSPKPQEARSHKAERPQSGSNSLKSSEEEWRPVMETLGKRFPNISQDKIIQALRDNDGHAGKAASMLRYM